jgi:hypothetical protein
LVNVGVLLAGFLLFALGFLVFVYLVIGKLTGRVKTRTLSITGNVSGNLPFILIMMGIMLIDAGSTMP